MCPQGTPAPIPCPPGTFQNDTGQTECLECIAGHYCPKYAITGNEIDEYRCWAGYICYAGSDTPYPNDPTDIVAAGGYICPIGHYCTAGATIETPCPAGTFEMREGSSECQQCPEGYYCEEGTSDPIICENGYCPKGSSSPTDCPLGQYTETQGLESQD
jgi:hypothetical protein